MGVCKIPRDVEDPRKCLRWRVVLKMFGCVFKTHGYVKDVWICVFKVQGCVQRCRDVCFRYRGMLKMC